MPSPSSRKMNQHAIRNHPAISPLNQIDLNTDGLETLLTSIRTAVEHTVITATHSLTIASGITHGFNAVDIGGTNGQYKFEVAGALSDPGLVFSIEVSQDGITYYPYPHTFTILGSNISAVYDMTFRFHKIKVSNSTGSSQTVNLIHSGRH